MSRRKQAKPQHLKSDEELQAEVLSEQGHGGPRLLPQAPGKDPFSGQVVEEKKMVSGPYDFLLALLQRE
ncbi:UNVERIFIED_CONTAM: hypothetical protein K2H54_056021 [Gekko kuhli]